MKYQWTSWPDIPVKKLSSPCNVEIENGLTMQGANLQLQNRLIPKLRKHGYCGFYFHNSINGYSISFCYRHRRQNGLTPNPP